MESKLEGISSLMFSIRCHGDVFMMASLHGRRPHGGVNLKSCSHDASPKVPDWFLLSSSKSE